MNTDTATQPAARAELLAALELAPQLVRRMTGAEVAADLPELDASVSVSSVDHKITIQLSTADMRDVVNVGDVLGLVDLSDYVTARGNRHVIMSGRVEGFAVEVVGVILQSDRIMP